ncbi:MAG: precorrin-3B synthase [Pseudomonadota bacterium]
MDILRRGACPSLSEPMTTGDGLLVRLNPAGGALRPEQLEGVAHAAVRDGNGIVEITSRGSLQVRGLTSDTTHRFAETVASLGIDAADGVEIRTGPLAGRESRAIADPRPLAEAIRVRLGSNGGAGRFAPKVSVVVDGGGALGLEELAADVRLQAHAAGTKTEWIVGAGGTSATAAVLGCGGDQVAVDAALRILDLLVEKGPRTRARDLSAEALAHTGTALRPARRPRTAKPVMPVGTFALRDGTFARGLAFPFGRILGKELAALAAAFDPAWELRLSPGRGMLALGLAPAQCEAIVAVAGRLGLVVQPDDPRMRIVACAGSPGCASAYLPTKTIAETIATQFPDLPEDVATIHLSGCSKKCARPSAPSVAVVGSAEGYAIEGDGLTIAPGVRQKVARLVDTCLPERRRSA